MIVSISRDGEHVADLLIDDMRDWAEVCNAIRERMFPDVALDTSRPVEPKREYCGDGYIPSEPKRRRKK